MAAPNLRSFTTMTAENNSLAVTTSVAALVNNPASSGKAIKVHTIYVANVDGTNACDVTIGLYAEDDVGGTVKYICKTLSIAADSSLVLNEIHNVKENQSIGILASADSDLEAIAYYDEIS